MAWQPEAEPAYAPNTAAVRPKPAHSDEWGVFTPTTASFDAGWAASPQQEAIHKQPKLAVAASSPSPPPQREWEGWRVFFHEGYQVPYYYHTASKTSAWERPDCVPEDAEPESTFAAQAGSTTSEPVQAEQLSPDAQDDTLAHARSVASVDFMTDTEARMASYARMEADAAVERAVAVFKRGTDGQMRAMQSMSASNAAMSLAGEESTTATGIDTIRFVDHEIDASYGVLQPERRSRFSSSRDAAAHALSPVSRDSYTSFTAAAAQRLQEQRSAPDDVIHRAASKIQGLCRMFQAVQQAKFLQKEAGIRNRRKRAEHHIERLRLREQMDQQMQQVERDRMRHRSMRLFVVDDVLKQQRGAIRAQAKQSQTDRRLHRAVLVFQAVLRRRVKHRNALVMAELRNRAAEVIQQAMKKWRNTVKFIGSIQMGRRVAEHRAKLGKEAAAKAAQARAAAAKLHEARRIQDEAAAEAQAEAAAAEAARREVEADPSYRAARAIQRAYRGRPAKMAGLVITELRKNVTMVCTKVRLSRLFHELKSPGASCLTRQQWLRETSGSGSSSTVTDSTRDLHSMQLAAAVASAASPPAAALSSSASSASEKEGGTKMKPLKAIGRSKWKIARASISSQSTGGLLTKLASSGGRRLHRASSSMRVDAALVNEKRKRSRISMQTSTTIFNAIDDDHSESIEEEEFVQFFQSDKPSAEMMDWITDAIINMESPHRDQESRARSVHKRMKQAVAPACHAAWCWRMSAAAGRFFDTCPGVATAGLTSVAFAGAIKASPGRSQLSAEEAVKLFRRMDDDSSGTIDRDEFTNGITEPVFESLQDWLLEHFSQGSRQQWAIVDHDAHCAPPLL